MWKLRKLNKNEVLKLWEKTNFEIEKAGKLFTKKESMLVAFDSMLKMPLHPSVFALCKTKKGRFYCYDIINQILFTTGDNSNIDNVIKLYDELPYKVMSFEEAFNQKSERIDNGLEQN